MFSFFPYETDREKNDFPTGGKKAENSVNRVVKFMRKTGIQLESKII